MISLQQVLNDFKKGAWAQTWILKKLSRFELEINQILFGKCKNKWNKKKNKPAPVVFNFINKSQQ